MTEPGRGGRDTSRQSVMPWVRRDSMDAECDGRYRTGVVATQGERRTPPWWVRDAFALRSGLLRPGMKVNTE